MAQSVSVPVTLPIGQTISQPFSISAVQGATQASATFDVTSWVDGTVLEVDLQLFLGGIWQTIASFGKIDRGTDTNGLLSMTCSVTVSFGQALPDTQLRVVANLTGSPFSTTVTLGAK